MRKPELSYLSRTQAERLGGMHGAFESSMAHTLASVAAERAAAIIERGALSGRPLSAEQLAELALAQHDAAVFQRCYAELLAWEKHCAETSEPLAAWRERQAREAEKTDWR